MCVLRHRMWVSRHDTPCRPTRPQGWDAPKKLRERWCHPLTCPLLRGERASLEASAIPPQVPVQDLGYAAENAQALRSAGVQVLRDAVAVVDERVVVVGRDDDMNSARPSLAALLKDVRRDLPVLVLDHRPTEILANVQTPMDIQFSGHTHNGQVFPANFIVRALYRLHYGHEQIEGKEIFVSSGYGFWGVPLRLGSRSEVLVIDVTGRKD